MISKRWAGEAGREPAIAAAKVSSWPRMNRLVLQFTAQLHLNRYSENSIQNHRLDLVKFKGWLEEADMGDLAALQKITPDHIRRYQAFLAGSLKQRSINRHLSSLRLFFGFLEESGLIS